MKNSLTMTVLVVAFSHTAFPALSQSSINTGVDIVSSYVWRGVPQGSNEPNIQPFVSYSHNRFCIGVWGSGNFSGSIKEFDLYATYTLNKHISFTMTDYDWTFAKNYFDYTKITDHIYEASIAYTISNSFPLSISCNTMFAGSDKNQDGDNSYSTYIELGYPVTGVARIFCGASLFESPSVYCTKGFGITNIGIKVSKNVEITDKFSLPVYGKTIFNPVANKAFLIAGITL